MASPWWKKVNKSIIYRPSYIQPKMVLLISAQAGLLVLPWKLFEELTNQPNKAN